MRFFRIEDARKPHGQFSFGPMLTVNQTDKNDLITGLISVTFVTVRDGTIVLEIDGDRFLMSSGIVAFKSSLSCAELVEL